MGTKNLIAYFENSHSQAKSNPSPAEETKIRKIQNYPTPAKINTEVNPTQPPSSTLKPPPNHLNKRRAATTSKQRKPPKLSPRLRKITTFFEKTNGKRENLATVDGEPQL